MYSNSSEIKQILGDSSNSIAKSENPTKSMRIHTQPRKTCELQFIFSDATKLDRISTVVLKSYCEGLPPNNIESIIPILILKKDNFSLLEAMKEQLESVSDADSNKVRLPA